MQDTQRRQLLNALAAMVTEDFGLPNEDGKFDVLCAHCQAHHGLDTLLGVYDDLEIDEIADQVISGRTN